jgi:hypothetical protein
MSTVDRREFVRLSAFCAGAAALPHWLAKALGQDPAMKTPGDGSRASALRTALTRARAYGKPLLVLLVPIDQNQRYERGQALGSFLNHGPRDALLELAFAELACATPDEATSVLGEVGLPADPARGTPWFVLVDPAEPAPGAARAARVVDPDFGELGEEPAMGKWQGQFAELEKEARRWAEARNAVVAKALHEVIAPDRGALATLADRCRATLAADERESLEKLLAGGKPPADVLLMRAAAVVAMAAEAPRRDGDRERLREALTDAAKRTLVDARIPGSKWAKSEGCGTEIEGDDDGGLRVACGMAFVPELDRRFLYFFSER